MSAPSTVIETDVVVVGAGPTGLYGAYYAGFRGLSTVVVDVLPQAGGQVMALYPEKQIRDVAALPSIRGRDFVANLVEQADTYEPTYLLGRQAVTLEHVDGSPVADARRRHRAAGRRGRHHRRHRHADAARRSAPATSGSATACRTSSSTPPSTPTRTS